MAPRGTKASLGNEKCIDSARERLEVRSEAEEQSGLQQQQEMLASSSLPFYDRYAILNLELPTNASHSDNKVDPQEAPVLQS